MSPAVRVSEITAHNLLRAQESQQTFSWWHSRASITRMSQAPLRPATAVDAQAIAAVWHAAWHDAHDAHVPAGLVDDRPLDYFTRRVPSLIDRTTVAEDASGIVGFVTVDDDELDLLFVAARGRGSGIAGELLAHGEQLIGARYDTAWLEVVTGNARARAFYARRGWRDTGPADCVIDTSSGPAEVPSHRYEKWLRR
jgi:ribosomal protein S18 acetylase RimI-like enzyme